MSIIQNTKYGSGLYLLLFFLIFSGCNVYDTVRVDSIDHESLALLHQRQHTVVIHDNREKNEFILTDFAIEGDILKGIIKPAPSGKTHQHHKKHFAATKVKAYNPLAVMHVYLRVNTLNIGPFETPISTIRFVEIHEGNTRKSMTRTFVPIGIGTLLVITWAIIR